MSGVGLYLANTINIGSGVFSFLIIVDKIKDLIYRGVTLGMEPIKQLLVPEAANSISFFCLHGINREIYAGNPLVCNSSRNADAFKRGLELILRKYRIISIDEAIKLLADGGEIRQNYVVLTFDDSLKCLVEVAAPILNELGVKGTFYLSTSVMDSDDYYWWHRLEYSVHYAENEAASVELSSGQRFDLRKKQINSELLPLKRALKFVSEQERNAVLLQLESELGSRLGDGINVYPCAEILNWQDAKELLDAGHTIGSHTVSHPNLAAISDDEIRYELAESKKVIQNRLGIECKHLCYPYGFHSIAAIQAAKDLGYASAVTTKEGWNKSGISNYEIKRFPMNNDTWKAPFQISGQHHIALKFIRIFGR